MRQELIPAQLLPAWARSDRSRPLVGTSPGRSCSACLHNKLPAVPGGFPRDGSATTGCAGCAAAARRWPSSACACVELAREAALNASPTTPEATAGLSLSSPQRMHDPGCRYTLRESRNTLPGRPQQRTLLLISCFVRSPSRCWELPVICLVGRVSAGLACRREGRGRARGGSGAVVHAAALRERLFFASRAKRARHVVLGDTKQSPRARWDGLACSDIPCTPTCKSAGPGSACGRAGVCAVGVPLPTSRASRAAKAIAAAAAAADGRSVAGRRQASSGKRGEGAGDRPTWLQGLAACTCSDRPALEQRSSAGQAMTRRYPPSRRPWGLACWRAHEDGAPRGRMETGRRWCSDLAPRHH